MSIAPSPAPQRKHRASSPVVEFTTLDRLMHNTRVKIWPDGSRDVMIAERAIFREPGYEVTDKWGSSPRAVDWDELFPVDPEELSGYTNERLLAREDERRALILSRAKRRARAAVYDTAMASAFAYFVTLTLDPAKVDRYDMAAITRKLNAWLDNQVRRHGLAYILVPERHKDGAVHFHGFFNGAVSAVDSGHKDKGGHTVFNLPGWTLGFSTAIPLYGDKRAAVGYCCKYITKAQEKIGGRWYYSGGKLGSPRVEYCDTPYGDFEAPEGCGKFCIDAIDCAVLSFRVDAP